MAEPEKITKESLLKTIENLEKNPNDRVRILGDAGISVLGTGLGAAAAGTIAASTGATSIFGLTAAAKLVGLTLVSSTPIGWIAGAAVLGGGAAYGISRFLKNGAMSEGQKKEILQQNREKLRDIEAKERAGNITEDDKNNFHISLKELIQKNVISPEKAQRLIDLVETGRLPISQAIKLVENIIQDKQTSNIDDIKNKADEEGGSVDLQLQKNGELLKALIREVEVAKEMMQHHSELLLTHDKAIVEHGFAFDKAQDFITLLEQKSQRAEERANGLQKLLYISLGISVISIVISVFHLFK